MLRLGVFALWVANAAAEQEMAFSADGFVDSMGVGTHITTISGPYAPATLDSVYRVLGALGMRHIRADMHGGTSMSRVDYVYNTYGIRSNLIANRNTADVSLATQISYAINDPAIESMEGANEPDVALGRGTPYTYTALNGTAYTDGPSVFSYTATQAFQNDFYNQLNGAKPMLSSAMGGPIWSRFLANAPYPLNAGSMHSYPNGRVPSGFALDNSSIPAVARLAPAGTRLPLIATETGYTTAVATPAGTYSGQPYVTKAAMGKYMPRLFAEYFNRGIARTYSYDLIDDGTDPYNQEHNFGLANYDFTPKPAYTGLQNLIALLGEKHWDASNKVWTGLANANFTPGALNYNLIGAGPLVHHTLLQKSDGVFYLLIWQEVPTCDIYHDHPHNDITNATVPVTLVVSTPIQKIDIYQPNDSTTPITNYTHPATLAHPSTITLDVPDQMMVVKLTPSTLAAPWVDTDIGAVGVTGTSAQVGGWAGEGARGDYFYKYDASSPDNFSAPAMSRMDSSVNFTWASTPPITSSSSFGVRWTGRIVPQYSENYTFTTQAAGGVVLWVNGTKVIDHWGSAGTGGILNGTPIALVAGQKYDIRMSSWHSASGSYAILKWSSPSLSSTAIPCPPANHWYITGAGGNIWSPADAFHYVYQPLVGDATITARVASLPAAYNAAKAGVMIRQSVTDASSANACVLVTPTRDINFQYRASSGSAASTVGVTGPGAPPYWVRLQRSGNVFSGSISPDGVTWTLLGSGTVPMGASGTPVYIGLPVCSRSTSGVERATFDSVAITYPTVTLQATTPTASRNPLTAGAFTVRRGGSSATSPALTVAYAVAGTAMSGADYAALSGTATIPAGADCATIDVTPLTSQVCPARTTVKLTLLSGSGYNIGGMASDTVQIPSNNLLADFENASLTNWTTQSQSALAIVHSPVDTGTNALKWTYTNVSGIPYSAEIHYNFATPQPQDWSRVTSVTVRIAPDPSNPASDIGQPIIFELIQNGSRVTGGWGVDVMNLDGLSGYRSVTFNLGNYARNQITGISFWVVGSRFSLGTHVWYIDNITTDTHLASNAAPPMVSANAATKTLCDAANVSATVNSNGLATICYYQYGLTTGYGNTTAVQSVESDATAALCSATCTGLAPATTYHYRLVATNSSGTTCGPDQTVTTTRALDFTTTRAQIKKLEREIQVGLQSVAGYNYQLQRASTLSTTAEWENIGVTQLGADAVLSLVDNEGAVAARAFYRVMISQ